MVGEVRIVGDALEQLDLWLVRVGVRVRARAWARLGLGLWLDQG